MEYSNDNLFGSEMMIYTTEDGLTKIETTFDGDTVWLSADQMAELFQRDKSTISRHIKNIFTEGELVRDSVVAKFATTATDGKTYQVEYYNLDVIISVGYRVKSKRGTQFRIWATGILKEFPAHSAGLSSWNPIVVLLPIPELPQNLFRRKNNVGVLYEETERLIFCGG